MVRARSHARHLVPWAVSGASGVHIAVRLWRATRSPAHEAPIYIFLLRYADVILVLGGSPVILWRLAQRQAGHLLRAERRPTRAEAIYELRDVFTAALLGLGLLKRKLAPGETAGLGLLTDRVSNIIRRGAAAVAALDAPVPSNPALPGDSSTPLT